MGIKINPFNPGLIDFIGSGSGGGTPITQTPNYFQTFTPFSWGSPSGGTYTITILATTHNKGTDPLVQVFELVSGNYESIIIPIINNSGDISMQVNSSPDSRFTGKIIISENN
jgi:hypothetical protein